MTTSIPPAPAPTAPRNTGELVQLLAESGLLAPKYLERIRIQVPQSGAKFSEPARLVKKLISLGVLTPYHGDLLLRGYRTGYYLGRYRLLLPLGTGGMGQVFLAEQQVLHRPVALKFLHQGHHHDPALLGRFAREAQAIAALHHPNIVQAFDFDHSQGINFLVMEYILGITTQQLVEQRGPRPWRQASDIGLQAARGLHAAHQAKFVHRDIKPANLMIDLNGQVKILDLGLVNMLREQDQQRINLSETQADVVLGTADFIAPEQALDSHRVDIRADIYSLGAVLHFLLTGNLLFPEGDVGAKLMAHFTQPPPKVRDTHPVVPAELERVILRMLAKEPEQRYQTPAEVAKALQPFAERVIPSYDESLLPIAPRQLANVLHYSPPMPLELPAAMSNTTFPLQEVVTPIRDTVGSPDSTSTDLPGLRPDEVEPYSDSPDPKTPQTDTFRKDRTVDDLK